MTVGSLMFLKNLGNADKKSGRSDEKSDSFA